MTAEQKIQRILNQQPENQVLQDFNDHLTLTLDTTYELDQYQTDHEIMREKQRRQKAEIYRGTRTQYSPAVQKWRQRQR